MATLLYQVFLILDPFDLEFHQLPFNLFELYLRFYYKYNKSRSKYYSDGSSVGRIWNNQPIRYKDFF